MADALQKSLPIAYGAAVAAAWANPAGLDEHQVSWSVQGASIATLVLLAPYARQRSTAFLAVLAASLGARLLSAALVRPDNTWMVRWDSFAKIASLVCTMGLAAFEVGGSTLATAAIVIGLPALVSLPNFQRRSLLEEHRPMLRSAIEFAAKAYEVYGEGDAEYVNDVATGTLAGVTTKDGDVYVFFSGSVSWTDWVRVNADVALVPFQAASCAHATSGKVHRGFANAYAAVKERVMIRLQDAMLRAGGAGRVVVCGHSLGGSLATLAALDIACTFDPKDRPKVACVTFGAAQAGDQAFVDAFDAAVPLSIRMVSVYDPVPKTFSAQFRHVKGETVVSSVPVLPMAHSLQTYGRGVEQNTWVTAAVLAMPVAAVCAATLLLSKRR